jgi:pimeloyl-ACP methyl ester carboxylesterase
MGVIAGALIDALLGELTARDANMPARLSLEGSADEWDRRLLALASPLNDLTAADRQAAIAHLLDAFRPEAGQSVTANAQLEDLLLAGLADALLAGQGVLDLTAPAPLPAMPLADQLGAEFDAVEAEGCRLFVSRRPGTPLVVVNALGIPLRLWQPLFAEQGWQLIVPELPCSPLPDGGMHCADSALHYAAALHQALQAVRLRQPPWLLGWCNGGRIALELARLTGGEAAGLLLLCPTFREPGALPSGTFEDKLQQLFTLIAHNPAAASSVSLMVRQLLAAPNWDAVPPEQYLPRLLTLPRTAFGQDLTVPMRSAAELKNYAQRTALDEQFADGRDFSRLGMPVWLLQGAQDEVVNNAQARTWLQQHVGQVTAFSLNGAGHTPQDLQYPYFAWFLRHARAGGTSRLPYRITAPV